MFVSLGKSVLLQDEEHHMNGGAQGGHFVIDFDGTDKSKYHQQLQLIDQQVR